MIRKVFDFDPISESTWIPQVKQTPDDGDQITMGAANKFKNRPNQEISGITGEIREELVEMGVETLAKVGAAAASVKKGFMSRVKEHNNLRAFAIPTTQT